jgi:hypothetical protein
LPCGNTPSGHPSGSQPGGQINFGYQESSSSQKMQQLHHSLRPQPMSDFETIRRDNNYYDYEQNPYPGIDDNFNDDVFLQKEKELRDLSELRIKTLERLVRDKQDLIQAQESDLDAATQQLQQLKMQLADRDRLLHDFDARLEQAKSLVKHRETEIAAAKTQLMDMYDQFSAEKEASAALQRRVHLLEREAKALEVRYLAEAEERVRVKEEECAHEIRKREVRLRECEKRAEMMKINGDERVNLAIDKKDKEIIKMSEEINRLRMENDVEVNKLEKRIEELLLDVAGKDRALESFKVHSAQQSGLL